MIIKNFIEPPIDNNNYLIIDEATKNGEKFARKGIYVVMIKYISPVLLLFLLLGALGLFNKVM